MMVQVSVHRLFILRFRDYLIFVLPVTLLGCVASGSADKTTTPPATPADRIVIEKSAHTMKLMRDDRASVVTSKPANGGRVKTGQRTVSGTELFYPVFSPSGKPVLVRQLRGPHFSRWPW